MHRCVRVTEGCALPYLHKVSHISTPHPLFTHPLFNQAHVVTTQVTTHFAINASENSEIFDLRKSLTYKSWRKKHELCSAVDEGVHPSFS